MCHGSRGGGEDLQGRAYNEEGLARLTSSSGSAPPPPARRARRRGIRCG